MHAVITIPAPQSVPLHQTANVLVFRTSVLKPVQVEMLRPWLDDLVRGGRWTFDLEDHDRVLRVETPDLVRERVIVLLNGLGFVCEEML